MIRQAIIEGILKFIDQLPEDKAEEISAFADFLRKHYEDDKLIKGIQQLSSGSQSFDFLKREEDIYTKEDLKKEYNS